MRKPRYLQLLLPCRRCLSTGKQDDTPVFGLINRKSRFIRTKPKPITPKRNVTIRILNYLKQTRLLWRRYRDANGRAANDFVYRAWRPCVLTSSTLAPQNHKQASSTSVASPTNKREGLLISDHFRSAGYGLANAWVMTGDALALQLTTIMFYSKKTKLLR